MTEREVAQPAVMELPAVHKGWLLVVVGIATFMTALDGSVVNTIVPVIQRVFGVSEAAIQWVVTTYLLVVSGLLLSFGRLGDLRGHRAIYLTGFGIFVLGSALCGLAPTLTVLVAARALQALGAAMLAANAPAILTRSFPAAQRGQALGLAATMTYLGLTVGPSLGGWLARAYGWRAVFYINLPVGAVALILGRLFIPHDEGAERPESFDLTGAVLFTVGLVTLLLGLNRGSAWGWGSPRVLGLLGLALVLLAAFLVVERRVAQPMLDLSLFRRWLFSAAAFSAVLNYICTYTVIFLLPFYLIRGRGLDSAEAGLVLTAQPLVMALVAPLSGTLSDRIGSRLPATLGMSVLALGLFLLARLTPTTPLPGVMARLAVTGLGLGLFVSPNNSALMGAAPRHRQGIAAGILATARSVGMVLGVGLAGAIFTTVLTRGEAAGSLTALLDGVAASFTVAAGIALLGAVISVVRGR